MTSTVRRGCNAATPTPDDLERLGFVPDDELDHLAWYDARHAAKYLSISEASMKTAKITYALVDGQRLFARADLDAYLDRPAVQARRARDAAGAVVRAPLAADRFPIEPLIVLLERRAGHDMPITEVADVIGLHPARVYVALHEGLTSRGADRAAVAAGYHPALVWGLDWWDEAKHASRRPAQRSAAEQASMRRHPSAARVRRLVAGTGFTTGDAA